MATASFQFPFQVISSSAERISLELLLADIAGPDPETRTAAWTRAGEVGAPAVRPLAELMNHSDAEVARAAKRGLWRIARNSGRPKAEEERRAVVSEILRLVSDEPSGSFLREAVWMLSEIGGEESVPALANLLSGSELADDARMALERIPGDQSLQALKKAFQAAPEDFKPNLAHSLRMRGTPVAGYPSAKLTPVKTTQVQPLK